jgi:TPR repeat protein
MRAAILSAAILASVAPPLMAQTNSEVLAARSLLADGDTEEAVTQLRVLAEAGDPLAQTIYGTSFFYGYEGVVDAEQVVFWLQKAADQNFAPGISDLAWFHRYGMEGLSPDPALARAGFERAAALGYARAAAELAAMLFEGAGGPADPERAVGLIRWAADMGDAFAAEQLGNSYFYGDGMPQNDWEARRFYGIAATQNFYVAQSQLGYMAMNGVGGSLDLPLAQDMLWEAMSSGLNTAGAHYSDLLAANPDLGASPVEIASYCLWARRFAAIIDTPPGELSCLPTLEGLDRMEMKEAGRLARELFPAP